MGRNKRESEDYRIEAQKAKYTKTTIKVEDFSFRKRKS
jgi:hypothetical protein